MFWYLWRFLPSLVEFDIKFCGFEQSLAAQHGFVVTEGQDTENIIETLNLRIIYSIASFLFIL